MNTVEQLKHHVEEAARVRWITLDQFAEYIGITTRQLRRLRSDPKMTPYLPVITELPNGRKIITVPDLFRWYYEHEDGIKASRMRKEANRSTSG